jgi:hypothetical protein
LSPPTFWSAQPAADQHKEARVGLFLSKSNMHQYFSWNIFDNRLDFVEYSFQMMDSILMKISESKEYKFLINMLAMRSTSFPLLTNILLVFGLINKQKTSWRQL